MSVGEQLGPPSSRRLARRPGPSTRVRVREVTTGPDGAVAHATRTAWPPRSRWRSAWPGRAARRSGWRSPCAPRPRLRAGRGLPARRGRAGLGRGPADGGLLHRRRRCSPEQEFNVVTVELGPPPATAPGRAVRRAVGGLVGLRRVRHREHRRRAGAVRRGRVLGRWADLRVAPGGAAGPARPAARRAARLRLHRRPARRRAVRRARHPVGRARGHRAPQHRRQGRRGPPARRPLRLPPRCCASAAGSASRSCRRRSWPTSACSPRSARRPAWRCTWPQRGGLCTAGFVRGRSATSSTRRPERVGV